MLLSSQHFEGGRGVCSSSGMGTRKSDKHQLLIRTCANQTTSWLMHSLNTFGARTSHEQTQTHKIHHGPNLREATTFPLIVYFVPLHEAQIQMTFCLGTPKWKSQNFQTIYGISATLGPHNFVCRPAIEIRFEAKL
jgi:hypothetical protein